MRIGPLNSGPYRTEGPSGPGPQKPACKTRASRVDQACRVTCSDRARLAHDVLKAAEALPAFRAEKVENLRQLVASGRFQAQNSLIAERIVAGLV